MADSFVGGENRIIQRKPLICRKRLTWSHNIVLSTSLHAWTGFELTALVMIGTDCTGSCNFINNTIYVFNLQFLNNLIMTKTDWWESFSEICHHSIFRPSCLGPLVYLLSKTFKLFGCSILWLCTYMMNIIPETRGSHLIRYIRFFTVLNK